MLSYAQRAAGDGIAVIPNRRNGLVRANRTKKVLFQ